MNVPTRVNAESLARAEQWTPWPNLLATEWTEPGRYTNKNWHGQLGEFEHGGRREDCNDQRCKLESEPRPPITEPPSEEVPFVPDPAGSDESDDDEDTDEIELSAEDRYQDNCAICHCDSCDC